MAKKTIAKTKVKDTLGKFLFNEILNNPEYQQWASEYQIPAHVTDNLSRTLRPYQAIALKVFIWLLDRDPEKAKHLLFNMATGAGKTLTMAAVVLYLYGKGYHNFIFLVHQLQIIGQAVRNFTDYKFDKYLFNPKGIKINGRNVEVRLIERFQDARPNSINFMFTCTPSLYNRLTEAKENSLCANDFKENRVVLLADEAHRLNVDTRKKLNKTEQEEITNWETSVMSAVYARKDNMLLEFTATVDLANEAIHKKYQNKLIYQYDFLAFNKDGYSKDVRFLFNQETQIEDQKRLLVINAVVLSEYRRLFAEREMNSSINPIVLIKSVKIAQSKDDRDFFHKVINSLRVDDLTHLKTLAMAGEGSEYLFLTQMFSWLASKRSGLVTVGDPDGLRGLISEIKMRFSTDNSMEYNSKEKSKAELLPLLDNPRNIIRAIFSVNALNEGWDVLSLYDIVHFDISPSKKVSLQDIQLIGRGARLCPYVLPRSYQTKLGGLFDEQHGYEFDRHKRKFDNAPHERGRILETFFYHFVKTGTFMESLQAQLLGEGIINEGVEKRTITLKPAFMNSETYKKGFVLVNQQQYRTKTTNTEIDTTFKREIKASAYRLYTVGLTDAEQSKVQAGIKHKIIHLTEEYFSKQLIRKALMAAENNFFRFNNLREHIVGIQSIDELIDKYLPLYAIRYSYSEGKSIEELSADEKLQLLIGVIMPEVRKAIDRHMPRIAGSNIFRPKSLASIFQQEKNIYLVSYPSSHTSDGGNTSNSPEERATAQTDHHNPDLRLDIKTADWYAYSENYGTGEEKRFVRFIASQIEELKKRYEGAEIYLIRNELDYWLFNPKDGRKFSPDYMLIVNDTKNSEMYYQCLIEPKGGHLVQQDTWKEEALISLDNNCQVVFDSNGEDSENYRDFLNEVKQHGYKEVKCLGFKFYNSDVRGESDFATDFQNRMPSLAD